MLGMDGTAGLRVGGVVDLEAGVDGDGDAHLLAELHTQGLLELAAQGTLEAVAGELVGHRHDGGVAVDGDRLAGAHPRLLTRLECGDDGPPGRVERRGDGWWGEGWWGRLVLSVPRS